MILNDILLKKIGFYDVLDLIYGESLIASEVYTGDFGIHKWGFSKKSLKILGRKFGIEFTDLKNSGYNIEAVGKKISEDDKSWKKSRITSWGNRVGIGEPYITLEKFMEKIGHEN